MSCLMVPALRALNRFAQVEVGETLFVVGDRRQFVFNLFVRDDGGSIVRCGRAGPRLRALR